MSKFPESDADIRKFMKEKGEHHHCVSLNSDDLDAHSWVMPKELRNRVGSAESQARTGETVRVYIGCENYAHFSVDVGFETRVSDPVVSVSGPQTTGYFSVPPSEKGQDSGVNWRFSALEGIVPNARAEVICEWSPSKIDRGRGRQTIVKVTTTK
jgi:hypothetical protein